MNTDSKRKTFRVALFVVVTIGILALLYALVFRIDFSGSFLLKVQFDYIGTIQVGSPVRKSGVKVGSVKSIEINEQDQKTVYVTLSLYKGQIVRQSDKVGIVSGGILGDQYIEIFPGDANAIILANGALVAGEKTLDLRNLAAQGEAILGDLNASSKILATFLSRNQQSLDRIVGNVERLTGNLADMSDQAKSLTSLVPYIQEKVISIGSKLDKSVTDLSDRLERIGKTYDRDIEPSMKDFQVSLSNIRDISENVKALAQALNGENGLVNLLKKKDTVQAIDDTLQNMKVLSENLKRISDALQKTLP